LTRQRQHPVGRVALLVTPPPLNPAITRTLSLPTLSTRTSEHQWGRRQGQEVGRAERAEREERPARPTSCPQDTRPTLCTVYRPFLPALFGRRSNHICGAPSVRFVYRPEAVRLAQLLGMINNSERTRRLLTTDPIPLQSPGALGYSPLFSFPFALLSTLRVASLKTHQRLSMR
jgi:hypothetical protein